MNQEYIDESTADGRPIYANEFDKIFIRQQGASTIRICNREGAVEALKNHEYKAAELDPALFFAEMDKNDDTLDEEFYSLDEESESEAWSIDVLASDTQSVRLAELDNEDTEGQKIKKSPGKISWNQINK